MGLDVYAGPVARYVAGNWLTIVQQAASEQGMRVEIVRAGGPQDGDDAVTDAGIVAEVVHDWQRALLAAVGVADGWDDRLDGDYETDKPDWDGYGAVVLLAAYDEQPGLAPGSVARRGIRRKATPDTAPREFADAPAYKEASRSPERYPTLLGGAEWCLPLSAGPTLFGASTPNGSEVLMGRVDNLRSELEELNRATLRLSASDLASVRRAGPPDTGAPVHAVAPFGLAVLLALAEYASRRRVPWIMDY